MTVLPIFPLGSVLLPGMPVALRIFEPRYLAMLSRVTEGTGEFGVVLIERGWEVGGGEHRFRLGTVAHINHQYPVEGWINVVAGGGQRFEVVDWLPDDPYPQAEVRLLPALEWSEELTPRRAVTERVVRRANAVASEFGSQQYPVDVELSDDPVLAAWQLAGIAPLGSLDHLALLGCTTAAELLDRTATLAAEAAETLALTGCVDFPDGP